ncbi:NEAT domain-containing protein [Paenibacillus macerans]|uniref:NEAT domain-containing protein n=1 Tax=Paenibacillus macerans TaxID=44252 RepID=UPI00204235A2|nr:NEAT domain-containing protein [Paenibacillus macerans]MCM3701198.1 NEAT domain-containing protein [Paenibacillus macerans]
MIQGLGKRFSALVLAGILSLLIIPAALAAVNLEDGTYSVNYTVLKADSDTASMADTYFAKPATVVVENGEVYAQVQLNSSSWITKLEVEHGGTFVEAQTVSSNSAANTRVVQFPLEGLTSPTNAKITVSIPAIGYSGYYDIRLAFDESSAAAQ